MWWGPPLEIWYDPDDDDMLYRAKCYTMTTEEKIVGPMQ